MEDNKLKPKEIREMYFLNKSEMLVGGAIISEWCIYVSESVYTTFINQSDVATIITSIVCIEAFIREEIQDFNTNFFKLVNAFGLDKETTKKLHKLRKFRNSIVHDKVLYDKYSEKDRQLYQEKCEDMAFLSIELIFLVFYSIPMI
jgi:hypothetical protein